jgi:hypothetical protein
MFLKTGWGKVSEKLSRYWGNVSEKSHAPSRAVEVPSLATAWASAEQESDDAS